MNEELKPCPFCGGTSLTIDYDKDGGGWYVSCDNILCNCSILQDTKEEAVKAWNRRPEQKEPDFYLCIESFLLLNIGDEGEVLETQSQILKGSMWSKEKSEYRFCSTSDSVRLENSERWIEISSDSFSKYFTPVWRNK